MQNEIKLIQAPVIQHELQRIGAEVTARIAALNIDNQVATIDTVKSLKENRAAKNKEFASFEEQRKIVKSLIMKPYLEFEEEYKIHIGDKYKEFDEKSKSKINSVEMELKTKTRNELIVYFNELCEFNDIDFLKFETVVPEVNLSTSEKKYKEQIFEFFNRVNEDLALIETETHAAEILTEYKRTLKASEAITTVRKRKEAEKLERERLLMERTGKRVNSLHALNFVYSDLTKTYRFVSDETLYISLSEIETLEADEWNKRFVLLEAAVKQAQKKSVSAPKTETKPAAENPTVSKMETVVQDEVFVAAFEVTGTYAELTRLKNFLTENNYNYKNI